MSQLPDAVIDAAVIEKPDCDCPTCVAVRAILEADEDAVHYVTIDPGVTILMQMTHRARCTGCGWTGDWMQTIDGAEAQARTHATKDSELVKS